jgi:hypothetical protein
LFHHFIITLKRTNKKGAFYFISSNLETFDRLLFPRPLDGVVVLIFLAIAGMKKGHIGGCITGIVSSLYRVVYYLVHNNTHKREFGVWPAVFFFSPNEFTCVPFNALCVCVFSSGILSLFFHFATKWNAIHRSCPFSSHFLIPMLLTMKEDAI